ncbi:hypothetical protein RVR_2805 [Actinacidiphila reveromycinica]|uniref:DUF6879 domain-containing protein n=1 Tax=Actinacidiphila reveromycinica TaxID=659352 RepID=A0A7U3UR37_9ACTN|nr:DUF6879 family protein [Streptomyces sp. SN-593]BBA97178.1 hypothetical protein RVR_2805 [Streptomyces sp. SN-593]
MARQLRYVGTNSGNNGCPTLYEADPDTYVVQGPRADASDLAQLRHLADDETAVTVPRALLANFGPKETIPTREPISFDDFDDMFTTFRHTAWRLETRRRYASDEATDTYQQFLQDGRADWDLADPWCVERREQTALGKTIGRVRVIDEPATPGQLYLLDNARRNTAVGETIRVLPRARAQEAALPDEDFWIFDSRVVALLAFDGDDLVGVDLITNPVEVSAYCQLRDAAEHHAIPFDQFEAVPSAE